MFDPVEVIKELVSHPSVSTDPAFAEGMEGTRKVLVDLFASMSLDVEVVDTPRHPVILAKRKGPESWPHVIIYGHYDVQPPDPLDLWKSPAFEPTTRDGRLYGRGASDNKGPMMVHIAAVAELLEEQPDLPLRITFLVEGEEEIGSPSLPGVLASHGDQLKGDFVLLTDTLNPDEDRIAITSGLRGIVSLEFSITTAPSDMHSGMVGGTFLNPIQALTELCSSLHLPDGRINVPGFYDDVIQPEAWEEEQVAKLGIDDDSFCKSLGIKKILTANGRTAMEAIRYEPTLEFNGIGGGYQGEGDKTVIPSTCFVKITCRLVANQDPDDIREKVIACLKERCPEDVTMNILEGHDGVPYSIVPPGKPNTAEGLNSHLARAFKAVDKAVLEATGTLPLYLREGGSIPIIGELKSALGMDALMIGMGTGKNKLHAPNESMVLADLPKGIAISKAVLKEVAKGS